MAMAASATHRKIAVSFFFMFALLLLCSDILSAPLRRGKRIETAFQKSRVPKKQLRLCVECSEGCLCIRKALSLDSIGLHQNVDGHGAIF